MSLKCPAAYVNCYDTSCHDPDLCAGFEAGTAVLAVWFATKS